MSKHKQSDNTICLNRKARHTYFIEETFEAGLMLEGWEVKSLREGRGQISESHIIVRQSELFLLNGVITPLNTVSTHFEPEMSRTRKLLMHKREIDKLMGRVEAQGYTIVPLKLYWKRNRVKVEIALAKGKKQHDKRQTDKDRDWKRQKERIFKKG
jgi:SsrA-binding protein